MNTRLLNLAHAADGRFFRPDERDDIVAFAHSVPARCRVAEAVEAREEPALRAVVETLQQKYPSFSKHHDQGWACCYRDLQLVLRHDVQAMIFDDCDMLDERILFWLRTMFSANNYTPQFCRDCFASLQDHMRTHLPADDFELLRPFLDRNIEVLGDFPEPVNPAV